MSKPHLTVFLCDSKDCSKAWQRICDSSPRKWLKHQVEDAGLPCKLDVIKTDCMDRCKHAANLVLIHEGRAHLETEITSPKDAARLLAVIAKLCGTASPSASLE
jgi:predicted metal-binding protein